MTHSKQSYRTSLHSDFRDGPAKKRWLCQPHLVDVDHGDVADGAGRRHSLGSHDVVTINREREPSRGHDFRHSTVGVKGQGQVVVLGEPAMGKGETDGLPSSSVAVEHKARKAVHPATLVRAD